MQMSKKYQALKWHARVFGINFPQSKNVYHGRSWLVVFVEVRAQRFLGNDARFFSRYIYIKRDRLGVNQVASSSRREKT